MGTSVARQSFRHEVFLSYASPDRAAVEEIAHRLRQEGVQLFFDQWSLIAGDVWSEGLEEGLDSSRTCAVFLGSGGVGNWQNEEMRSAIEDRARDRSRRVFGVLLPGADEGRIPRFLRRASWVDLRGGLDETALLRLLSAVRGVAPGPGPAALPPSEQPPLIPEVQECLERLRAGFQMVFDRVRVERMVPRPWLDARIDAALQSRRAGGYVHLEAQPGAGKTAFLARFLRERDLPGFFFDASQGITKPAQLHEALWAQLVARGHLVGGRRPERLGGDSRVLHRLLAEAAQRSGASLLFIVDALDEADHVYGAPALLPDLPAGVSCLTSARPGTPAPPGALLVPLDVEGSESVSDVRRFVEAQAAEEALANVLAAHDRTSGWLTREISTRAGGLFAFAHFVLTDLAEGRLRPTDLKRLGPGLAGYFGFTWRRWQEGDKDRFRALLRPALAAVAVAQAPVSPEAVAGWAGLDAADAEEVLRWDLRPWVTLARLPSGTAYRLYHQSVQEFLGEEIPSLLGKARAASAEYCLRLMHRNASEEPIDSRRYAVQHGLRHLIDAGRFDQAADALFDLEFLDPHRELAGNGAVLGELRIVRRRVQRRPVGRLLQVWSDEESGINDTSSLLSQLSYRLKCDSDLAAEMAASFDRLSQRFDGAWLRCCNPVKPRSSGSLVLRGHEGFVNYCVMSVDECRLVSASWDGTLRVWDLEEPEQEPSVLRGHERQVCECALSTNGNRLISASLDGTLRVWNLEDPDCIATVLRGHEHWVTHCALSPDGRRAVSASEDQTLRVWNLMEPEPACRILAVNTGKVIHCSITSDGGRLVSASYLGTLQVWDLEDLDSEPCVLRRSDGKLTCCAVSPDGQRAVFRSSGGTWEVWDLKEPRREPILFPSREDDVRNCVLSGDGRRLVGVAADRTPRVWDLEEPERAPRVLAGHELPVNCCALSLDGRHLVTGSADKMLRVWDLDDSADYPRILRGHENGITHCVLSSDARRLVSASIDKTLRIWDLEEPGHEPSFQDTHWDCVSDCALSSDGDCLVSASHDHTLRVWDLEEPEREPRVLEGHRSIVTRCALSPDGRRLVSSSYDGTLRVWDLKNPGYEPRVLRLDYFERVTTFALSTDGRRLVSGSDRGDLQVWDLEEPEREPRVLRGHEGSVEDCAMGPNGHRLVSASIDGTLRVWDLEQLEREPRILRGHSKWVNCCALNAEGRLLVSGSADGTLRVWDLDEPEPKPEVLRGHEEGVTFCLLSPDGRRTVSASGDMTLRVWYLGRADREPSVLRGHEDSVVHCALNYKGDRLVSASSDGTLRIWSLDSASELTRFHAVSTVTWVGWAREGGWVLAADRSGRVWMLELVERIPGR